MHNKRTVYLEFDQQLNKIEKKKELRHGLSVVTQVGPTLWLTNDETISLERLSFKGTDAEGAYNFGDHKQFALHDYLSLPVPPDPADPENFEEADIEGIDYKDGYLWLVGSHSLKRKKADEKDPEEENLNNLAGVSSEGNRFLLARIPMVKEGDTYTLTQKVKEGGKTRTAAQLKGNEKGNDLTKKLRKDPHLKAFFDIPGKDNGFDIEGLAINENCVFLGLRGPVLRGWAVVLALELKESNKKGETKLKLKNFRKYFLQLGGLGIRDLCIQGSDLLILAGPTMDLDGPVTVFRWKDAAQAKNSFVFQNDLEIVSEVPYGKGNDHAEGMTVFSTGEEGQNALLIVYDSACEDRFCGTSGVKADVFWL